MAGCEAPLLTTVGGISRGNGESVRAMRDLAEAAQSGGAWLNALAQIGLCLSPTSTKDARR